MLDDGAEAALAGAHPTTAATQHNNKLGDTQADSRAGGSSLQPLEEETLRETYKGSRASVFDFVIDGIDGLSVCWSQCLMVSVSDGLSV